MAKTTYPPTHALSNQELARLLERMARTIVPNGEHTVLDEAAFRIRNSRVGQPEYAEMRR